jgi:parvulin-like peptidyl-prolyl isomerase
VGPWRSGYGWHLIYITERTPGAIPAFDAIHDKVLADYTEAQRRILNAATFERLRQKYKVVFDGATQ